jgi:hypothetical protein
MTETYAATIAAVAPVLWLVAAVEMHQYLRRLAEPLQYNAELARVRRRAEGTEGPPSAELLAQVEAAIPPEGHASMEAEAPVRSRIAQAYLLVAALLLGAETVSLMWLGGAKHADSGFAWFCLVAVLLGFLIVTFAPAWLAHGEALYGHRQWERDTRLLRAWVRTQRRELDERENRHPDTQS